MGIIYAFDETVKTRATLHEDLMKAGPIIFDGPDQNFTYLCNNLPWYDGIYGYTYDKTGLRDSMFYIEGKGWCYPIDVQIYLEGKWEKLNTAETMVEKGEMIVELLSAYPPSGRISVPFRTYKCVF